MKKIWKYFPVLLGITFIAASVHLDAIRQIGTLARWLVLGLGVLLGMTMRSPSSAWNRRKKVMGMDQGAILFLCICFCSTFWSVNPGYTLFRSVSVLLLYVCCFWSLWRWVNRFGEMRLLDQFLKVLGWFLVFNLLLGGTVVPGAFLAGRFRGLLENPNTLAISIGFFMPLIVYMSLKRLNKRNVLFLSASVLSLLLSGGRTGLIIALFAGGAVFLKNKSANRGRLFVAAAIVAGLALIWNMDPVINFVRVNVLRMDPENLFSNRQVAWELASEYIAQRPYLGHGFGTDGLLHDYYDSKLTVRVQGLASSYYGLAAQLGLPLTVLFFGGLGWFCIKTFRLGMRGRPLIMVYSTIMVGGLMACFTEPWITSAGNAFSWLYWTVAMLLCRQMVMEKRMRTYQKKRPDVYRPEQRPALDAGPVTSSA